MITYVGDMNTYTKKLLLTRLYKLGKYAWAQGLVIPHSQFDVMRSWMYGGIGMSFRSPGEEQEYAWGSGTCGSIRQQHRLHATMDGQRGGHGFQVKVVLQLPGCIR